MKRYPLGGLQPPWSRRFATRGVAFAVVACVLTAIARPLQARMIALSFGSSMTLLICLVLIEAVLFVAIASNVEDRKMSEPDYAFEKRAHSDDGKRSAGWNPPTAPSHSLPRRTESRQNAAIGQKAA